MSHPAPYKRALHLRPRSNSAQRVWHIGKGKLISASTDRNKLRLAVLPDHHGNFASLKALLSQLGPNAGPEMNSDLARLNSFLNQVCLEDGKAEDDTIVKFLANSVSFAIMRRISRESVYTARLIDLGARTLNRILSRIPDCKSVHVEHVDRLDRPTLKVLARAMLLLEPDDKFSWVWHLDCDPTVGDTQHPEDVFNISRRHLLLQLIGVLSPRIERCGNGGLLIRPNAQAGPHATKLNISAALVMQNYDACLLWCDELIHSTDTKESIEGLRLRALAAVNIGKPSIALDALRRAENLSVQPGQRAHLCYLQGLIDAKRTYDLSSSTDHYLRGMAALDNSTGNGRNGEDLALERGWLCNGLALNDAILWRRDPATELYRKAFELEQEAFNLVKDGDDPARTYLRFNLLANTAFLLEMQGRYDLAIDLFHKAFDLEIDELPNLKERWLSTIGYRIGVLHYRAGQFEQAYSLLQNAAENDANAENWSTYERILRALGVVMLELGLFSEAAITFNKGLNICQGARSADGTREHGRGLVAALAMNGQVQKARQICEALRAEEEIDIVSDEKLTAGDLGQLRPSPPSPKLPAYIPEIDLEGIPGIDLNRFLGKAMQDGPEVIPWRS